MNQTSSGLVSIVVNNYNYARYLPEAIDSALAQTHEHTEVIVVDDGSTDNSRDIIGRYGDRIIPVLKENGGQASAFNAGFATSRGVLIIFLDSDDVLFPHIARKVAEVFHGRPDAGSICYRLAIADASGRLTGRLEPPSFKQLPHGDLRRRVLNECDSVRWTATTGNAFAAGALKRVFPLHEKDIRGCADYYVQRATVLVAPVVALEEVGGCYRIHGANSFYSSAELDQNSRQKIWSMTRVCDAYAHLVDVAVASGVLDAAHALPNPLTQPDVVFLAKRMISAKLDARHHPFKQDTVWQLGWRGAWASLQSGATSLPTKFAHMAWFVAMVPAPRPMAEWLAQEFFHLRVSARVRKLVAGLRMRRKGAAETSDRRLAL